MMNLYHDSKSYDGGPTDLARDLWAVVNLNEKRRFQCCLVFYVPYNQLAYTGNASDKMELWIRAIQGHNPSS
eukprot:12670674-Prorocentrum_lima.AAC.1